ncbi:MAG: 2-isopropylmalate synthase [bacterium]|nr:2-isopropylmalate synthase [bacterium]
MKDSKKKYRPFTPVDLKDRTWPNKTITQAPRWCSVDLRDGNQALVTPMNLEQKLNMFKLLVDIGFKEIEVGFPSASQVEFDFVRILIERKLIPLDVTVQVLTQAREHLIETTCRSLVGAKRALIHMYNSTSELQRRVVFRMGKPEIKEMAVKGTAWVRQYSEKYLSSKGGSASGGKATEVLYEYSPESFMGTELDYAVEVCDAVIEEWKPRAGEKVIINLPNTVEMSTPNIYADQIEWFCRHFKSRDKAIISLHVHNDRGCAVAATELGMMAGAERVEGTLFGNGERTGNVDIITLALNLHTQGIDPQLDLSDLDRCIEVYQSCTDLPVHPRHPYAGELVFTAFSGSHQDAIDKGFQAMKDSGKPLWEVPYIPMDPKDVGHTYEAVIRINSQSGKGGVAHILRNEFGYNTPKAMHPELGKMIQRISDATGKEVLPGAIQKAFEDEYLNRSSPISLRSFKIKDESSGKGDVTTLSAVIKMNGKKRTVTSTGNGPIDAFSKALKRAGAGHYSFLSYEEHALGKGEDARAVAYIQIADEKGNSFFGIGTDFNIVGASLRALLSALNRSEQSAQKVKRASPARAKKRQ